MKELSFVIWGTPVPKGRPRFSRNGHAFTPAKTREYEALVKATALQAVELNGWDPNEETDYRIDVRVYRAAKRGDLENYVKAVCDGCNGILWPDDRMIEVIRAQRYDTDKKNPRVELTVKKA